MTTIPAATASEQQRQPGDRQYYLVGRVPVRLEELAGGGVAVMAFNPLLGGFVSDMRYYSTIIRHKGEGDGDGDGVHRISETKFAEQIELLKSRYFPVHS